MRESINNKAQMDRMGFDAWADNLMVNMIEDHHVEGTGIVTIENDTFTARLSWEGNHVHFSIRCHTDEGWKEHQREVRI